MRVFVAGATGALGRPLVPRLLAAGDEVIAMTRSPARAGQLQAIGAEAVVCDALDAGALQAAVVGARPDVVVHLLTAIPARINPRRMARDFAANDRLREEGTRHLVAAARAAGARRLVAESIAFAYVPPRGGPRGAPAHVESDPLALDAKPPWRRSVHALAALEREVLGADGIEGLVLRYGYLYGPGTSYSADGSTTAQVRRRRFPIVGDGAGVWSFVHVDDAAEATRLAVHASTTGVLNIVDDEPAPVAAWLPAFASAIDAPPPRRVPVPVARIMAGSYAVMLMTAMGGAEATRARAELGWRPQRQTWREGFRGSVEEAAAQPAAS